MSQLSENYDASPISMIYGVFCWFCTVAPKTRKSLLLVVTTGFSDILWCYLHSIYAHAFDKNKRKAQEKLGKAIGL